MCVYRYTHIVLVIYVERLTEKKKKTNNNIEWLNYVTFTHMLHL